MLLRAAVSLLWTGAIADGSGISTRGAGSRGDGAVAFIGTSRPSFFSLGGLQPSQYSTSERALSCSVCCSRSVLVRTPWQIRVSLDSDYKYEVTHEHEQHRPADTTALKIE